MRVILCCFTPDGPAAAVGGGVLGWKLLDDFSVGPLTDWTDPRQFRAARGAFWATIPQRWLGYGEELDHVFWYQFYPKIQIADLVAEDSSDDDFLDDLETLVTPDQAFELWVDDQIRGQLTLWYALAELTRLGVGLDRVARCRFPDMCLTPFSEGFWQRMLTDAPDRDIAPVAISAPERDHLLRCWQAAVAMPKAVPADLAQDPAAGTVFRVLAGRAPDPVTGLNNLQTRLLQATPTDWIRMARAIGEAMWLGDKAGDRVGDSVLQAELTGLAHRQPALVELAGPGAMQTTQVRLTPEGQRLRARLAQD